MDEKNSSVRQGRAKGLYDEQLQRERQEKLVERGGGEKPALFSGGKLPEQGRR